jgi:DNA-binding beta-propeller fold protein YncE
VKDKWATTCGTDLASVAFSPDRRDLVGACGSDTVLWDVGSPSQPHKTSDLGGIGDADGMAGPALFTPHGRQLLRATKRGVLLWYVENPAQPTAAASFGDTPSGFQTTMKFSGGSRRLLVIHGANGGALWNLTGASTLHKSVARLPGSGDIGAEGAAFSPDGRILALSELSGARHVVRLRDTTRYGAPVLATITGIANGVEGLSFSADGHLLAVADNNDHTTVVGRPPSVKVFDVTHVSRPRQTASMKGAVFSAAFAPTGRLLVANSGDKLLSWTVADSRHPVAQPTWWLTAGATVSESAFRPDGKLLAVTDTQDTTRLVPIEDGRINVGHQVLMRTIGSGEGITFSPDGRTLAWGSSGDLDNQIAETKGHIELWDVSNWKAPVYEAAFAYGLDSLGSFGTLSYSTQHKPLLVAGGTTVNVWSTNPSDLTYVLCKSIGDVIKKEEWQDYVPGEPYDPPCS